MKRNKKTQTYLTRDEVEKLVAAFIKQADKLDEQALDAKSEKDAKQFRKHALWLRQKVSEIKGERIPTRTTAPPEDDDE